MSGFLISAFVLLFSGVAAFAQAPETAQEGGDFTFKRVAPPSAGAGKRITVQIDPNEEIFRITPGAAPRLPGDPPPQTANGLPPGASPGVPSLPSAMRQEHNAAGIFSTIQVCDQPVCFATGELNSLS